MTIIEAYNLQTGKENKFSNMDNSKELDPRTSNFIKSIVKHREKLYEQQEQEEMEKQIDKAVAEAVLKKLEELK